MIYVLFEGKPLFSMNNINLTKGLLPNIGDNVTYQGNTYKVIGREFVYRSEYCLNQIELINISVELWK